MFRFLLIIAIILLLIMSFAIALYAPYRLSFFAKDFGVFTKRQEYEYQHIDSTEQKRGKIVVANEKLEDHEELDRYVLPIEQESDDERLFQMLELIEGDNSPKTYLKGTIKGIITTLNIHDSGGGSNLVISTSGSLLKNYSDVNKENKILFRIHEIMLANYINRLEPLKQRKLILSQVCAINNVRGCSATSMIMFNNSQAPTDRERLILVSSVRWPITETNQKLLVDYANNQCPKLNKNGFEIGDCDFTEQDFKPKGSIQDFRKTGLIAPFCTGLVETFPQKRLLVEKVQKIVDTLNADVELSVFKYTTDSAKKSILARCSNNQMIAQHGFNTNMNIASISKLFLLLSKQNLPENIITAMQSSNNDEIKKIAESESISQMEIESQFHDIGIKPIQYGKDFAQSVSKGYVSMSSDDIHTFLFSLKDRRQKTNHRQAMKSALNGTLSYQKSTLRAHKVLDGILVAKTGTHSLRKNEDKKLDIGVHGSLVVYMLKYKNEFYTIVARIHSKPNEQEITPPKQEITPPICLEENCTRPALEELVDASFFIIKQQP